MTLIAIVEDIFVGISDCLITNGVPGDKGVFLPSLGYVAEIAQYIVPQPSFLMRKSHMIDYQGQKATLLFSGTVEHFRCYVRNLELLLAKNLDISTWLDADLDRDSVESVIRVCWKHNRLLGCHDFTMIALIGKKIITIGNTNDPRRNYDYYGNVICAGTGLKVLDLELKQRGPQYNQKIEHDDVVSRMIRAIHSIPSIMLDHDTRDSLRTLDAGTGGYYESHTMQEGCLVPVGEILYLFIRLNPDGDLNAIELSRLFFHFYLEDWLFVVTLLGPSESFPGQTTKYWRMSLGQSIDIPMNHFRVTPIQPLLGGKLEYTLDIPRLVTAINSPASYGLSLYNSSNYSTGTKRISGCGSPEFFRIEAIGDTARVTIEESSFRPIADKLPLHPNKDSVITQDHRVFRDMK